MSSFQRMKQRVSLAYLMAAGALFPCSSQAQSIESIINRTTHYLQGSLARSVGVACIIIAGYLCLYRQKFPKEYFSMILVGLGIIFGGSTLYNTLIG